MFWQTGPVEASEERALEDKRLGQRSGDTGDDCKDHVPDGTVECSNILEVLFSVGVDDVDVHTIRCPAGSDSRRGGTHDREGGEESGEEGSKLHCCSIRVGFRTEMS